MDDLLIKLRLEKILEHIEEVQNEFRILEEKIHRQLTHDEKKAIARRMIRERQGK